MKRILGQFVLPVVLFIGPSFLRAENAASLATIHEHPKDPHGLAQYHAFVFVGEISRMETHQHLWAKRPWESSRIRGRLFMRFGT
jgi:hypothetical protein